MAKFAGFKPEGMRKIATKMGYQGSMDDFDNYLQQNPEKKRQMIVYESMARQMAKGGVIKAQQGQFIGPVEAGPPAGFFKNQETSKKIMQGQPVGGSPQQGQFFNNLTKNINQFKINSKYDFLDKILLRVLKNNSNEMGNIFFKVFNSKPKTAINFLSNKSSFFEDLEVILKMPKWKFLKELI